MSYLKAGENHSSGLDCKIQFFVSFSSMHKHPTILPDIVTSPAAANENQSPRRHALRARRQARRAKIKREIEKKVMYNPLQKKRDRVCSRNPCTSCSRPLHRQPSPPLLLLTLHRWDRFWPQLVSLDASRLGFIQSPKQRVDFHPRLDGREDRGHDLGALNHTVDVVEAHEGHANVLSSVGLWQRVSSVLLSRSCRSRTVSQAALLLVN